MTLRRFAPLVAALACGCGPSGSRFSVGPYDFSSPSSDGAAPPADLAAPAPADPAPAEPAPVEVPAP